MAVTASPLLPGAWLGLLGGGQLGRMFAHAAQRLGYRVLVLAPDNDNPAGRVADEFLCAAYADPTALGELARRVGAVTTEFENVPAPALEFLAQHVPVRPGILKTTRLGYDGKGQIRVATRAHVGAAFRQLNGVPCVLEQQLALSCELS